MDPGLSSRMQRTLETSLPHRATPPRQQHNPTPTTVDLSSAQNEVLRPELLEFFKSAVENQVSSSVFTLPAPDGGDPQLRDALASFFNAHFHPVHPVTAEHIVLTAGATDAIESVIHAVCDDGDSVLVPGPSWHGFTPMLATRANVNIVVAQPPTYANWDNYLVPSLQAVYDFSADKSRIKAVVLCNPHNPLARCYPKKALLELMEWCQEHGLHLVVDEIYALTDLTDVPDKSAGFVSALGLTEPLRSEGAVKIEASRVHTVWSASKVFGMSGFRVGCIISQHNPTLLAALSLLTTSHTSAISSTYLTHLLTWPRLPTLLALNSERLTSSYGVLAAFLIAHSIDFVPPSHGLFVWARLAKGARCADDEKRFFEDLLARTDVKVGEGRSYRGVEGEFGWARLRFSMPEAEMQDAVARIESVMGKGAE